jgi:hypothetical protein
VSGVGYRLWVVWETGAGMTRAVDSSPVGIQIDPDPDFDFDFDFDFNIEVPPIPVTERFVQPTLEPETFCIDPGDMVDSARP